MVPIVAFVRKSYFAKASQKRAPGSVLFLIMGALLEKTKKK